MTEARWLACLDPLPMLEQLGAGASVRKLRLFICAVGFRLWDWLPDDHKPALGVAERLADGDCTEPERALAYDRAGGDWSLLSAQADFIPAMALQDSDLNRHAADAARAATRITGPGGYILPVAAAQKAAVATAHARLLRCFFGNPFRPVSLDPDWRTPTALALAEAIYADRTWDRLPVLADALEDAGCTDPDVIGHLRGPGPHARGCWVVDLILGKS